MGPSFLSLPIARWPLGAWLLLAVALLWRALGLLRPLYLDEYATLEVLEQPFWQAISLLRWDTVHPGYFLLLYGWYGVAHNLAWLRLLSVLFDMATLVGLLQLGKRMYGSWLNVGVLVWIIHPLVLRFAIELRPYAALSCCTIWAMLASQAYLQDATEATLRYRRMGVIGWWCLLIFLHPVGIMTMVACMGAFLLDRIGNSISWQTAAKSSGLLLWQQFAPQLRRLAWIGLPVFGWFALLHWGFLLDHSGQRISWIPPLSMQLLRDISNTLAGVDGGVLLQANGWLPWDPYQWPQGGLGLLLLTAAGLMCWFASKQGRLWLVAAMLHAGLICGYSWLIQPIAWYRSLLPSLALLIGAWSCVPIGSTTALGFAALARLAVGYVCGLVWLLLAMVHWWSFADRAIDPSGAIAQHAQATLPTGGQIAVFPDYLYITVLPHLPARQSYQVVPLEKVAPPAGAVIVRLEQVPMLSESKLAQALLRLRQTAVGPYDFFVTLTDDDDRLLHYRNLLEQALQSIAQQFAPCQALAFPSARAAHLRCLVE